MTLFIMFSYFNVFQNAMETQMGVSGFREAQENMEVVSTMKAEVDQRKGQTLEEMSGMVMELNHKIAERKARLAPIIKGKTKGRKPS